MKRRANLKQLMENSFFSRDKRTLCLGSMNGNKMKRRKGRADYCFVKRFVSLQLAIMCVFLSIVFSPQEALAATIASSDINTLLSKYNCTGGTRYWTYDIANGNKKSGVASSNKRTVTASKEASSKSGWAGYRFPLGTAYPNGYAECAGFALFLGWAISGGQNPLSSSKWTRYKSFDAAGKLRVGDIVGIKYRKKNGGTSTHMAMVYSSSNGNYRFVQASGGSNNLIKVNAPFWVSALDKKGKNLSGCSTNTVEQLKYIQCGTYSNGIVVYRYTGSVKIVEPPAKTKIEQKISVSGEKFPSNGEQLVKGKSFGLRGIYRVNTGKITSVTATLKTSKGTTKYSFACKPNSSSFDVTKTKGTNGKTLNDTFGFKSLAKGNYVVTLQINGDQDATYSLKRSFTVGVIITPTTVPVTPEPIVQIITVTNETFPAENANLPQGKSFGLRGKYSVNTGKIISVTASLKNNSDKEIYSFSCTPNTSIFDVTSTKGINNKTLNDTMGFSKLDAGRYKLSIQIKGNGNAVYFLSRIFTVGDGPKFTVNTAFKAPTSLAKGSNFGLRGKVSIDCGVIISVKASIKDMSDQIVSGFDYSNAPNVKSFDIQNTINNAFKFGKLPKGTFTYMVEFVADLNGISKSYKFTQKFTVK